MYFQSDAGTYWYEISGTGDPVLLLHGFTGSTKTWRPFVDCWKEYCRCIAVDLPGHGNTTLHAPRNMHECCSDLRDLLDHLEVDMVHIIGYSMGGRTALSFAMYYPERVSSLTLESATAGLEEADSRAGRADQDERLAQYLENNGLEAFIDYWEGIPLFSTQDKLPLSAKEHLRAERLDQEASGLAASLRYMGTGSQPSWWHDLERMHKPVHLIIGELDRKYGAINHDMHEKLPNASFSIVPGAGHAVHVEDPSEFDRLVMAYLKQNQRSR